jgi:hypothetical protein
LWLLSPAGLRLEISCETHKKKMNLIFNSDKKIFLTGRMSTRVGTKTRNKCVEKITREPIRDGFGNRRDEQPSLLIACASRVDRISLCEQFPASASGGQTLSKL